jgi:hypothetical protein
MNLDFNKTLKLTFSKQTIFENQTLDINLWLHITHHFLEIAEYAYTQSIFSNLFLDLIVLHSSTDSQTFSLVARESTVSPSAK